MRYEVVLMAGAEAHMAALSSPLRSPVWARLTGLAESPATLSEPSPLPLPFQV